MDTRSVYCTEEPKTWWMALIYVLDWGEKMGSSNKDTQTSILPEKQV